jgi:hypothetical protein
MHRRQDHFEGNDLSEGRHSFVSTGRSRPANLEPTTNSRMQEFGYHGDECDKMM